MKKKVIIIGGGASGLIAAIAAAQNGATVTVLEHKDRVGKKILMTGNGKCNLTNLNDYHEKYYSENIDFVYEILSKFSPLDTCDFFRNLGLYTKEKRDGGIYPVSEQAATVLDILRQGCEHYKVNTLVNCKVMDINPKKRIVKYKIDDNEINQEYDSLIISTGGKAASVSGSDGSGYELVKKLDINIIKPLPALMGLKCEGSYFKALAGIRTQASLKLLIDSECVYEEEGELQLTDYGISGIPVFQFSRIAARALDKKKKVNVLINFIPYISIENINSLFRDREKYSYKTLEEYLVGLINKKLISVICKITGLNLNIRLKDISKKDFDALIKLLTGFEVKAIATNSFEQAQVTSGGVDLKELNSNLSLKRYDNIFMTGEILDCDGICGGYNLQWAWATGYIAGINASRN